MKKLIALLAVPFFALAIGNANAGTSAAHSNPVKDLIIEHMLSTGYVTQAELDAQAAEREALKAAIEELKAAGDFEGIKALIEEAKLARQENAEALKAYVEANPDLAAEIEALIEKIRAEHAAAREARKASRGL